MKIELLLEKVKNFRSREAERKKYTGEDFNIFEILGIGHLEAATHSKFLGNLLNPQGSHSQGTLFLELFLDELGITTLNINNAKVELEKSVGEQGRLDIYITDYENTSIVIENKIYAELQDRQLERYCEFLEIEKCKNKYLIFLTLSPYDRKSEENIITPIKKWTQIVKFNHISYQCEMVSWLEKCREKAVQLPLIRESLTQYIQTIKILTNMNTTHNMIDELFKFAEKDSENYNSIKEISNAFQGLRKLILRKLFTLIKSKFDDEFKIEEYCPETGGMCLAIYTDKLERKGLKYYITTERLDYGEQFVGFKDEKGKEWNMDLSRFIREKTKFNKYSYNQYWTYRYLEKNTDDGACKFYFECVKNPSKLDSFLSEIKELIKLVETSDL